MAGPVHTAHFDDRRLRLALVAGFAVFILLEPQWLEGANPRIIDCRQVQDVTCGDPPPAPGERPGILGRLEARAQAFAAVAEEQDLLDDGLPNLRKAYPLVIRDYAAWDERLPGHEQWQLREGMLEFCADHYHNVWRNERMTWPVTADGEADWFDIYVQVLDHHFGYCR